MQFLAFSAITVFMAFTTGWVGDWDIADDYAVRFSGNGAEGTFSDLQGTLRFSPAEPAKATMDVSVAVSTISTGNNTKDKHARGEDWFDAAQYPNIRFVSNAITVTDEGYEARGTLTMKGVSKTVTIPFTFAETNQGGLFTGKLTVDRQDYNIKGPFLSFMVGDEFEIDLRVPVLD